MSNITYCNQYLSLDAAKANATTYAEVRTIRAYYYFLMLDLFGDAPFITAISADLPQQAHAYHTDFDATKSYTRAELLKMGREFLFKWVEGELLAVKDQLLPAKFEKDTDADYGRIDQAGAWLLLSRLYLNAGTYLNNDGQNNPHWQEAFDYANKVITESDYKLFDETMISDVAKTNGYRLYDLLFMGDNGSNGASCEAILPLLQDGKVTKGWGGSCSL